MKTQEEKHTKGPWAWQLFGDTYMLTAQHGMREIIIGAIEHGEMKYPVVAMNNEEHGRLEDVDKDHPNAKLIASAPELLEKNKNFLEALKTIKKSMYDSTYVTKKAILKIAEQAIKENS